MKYTITEQSMVVCYE